MSLEGSRRKIEARCELDQGVRVALVEKHANRMLCRQRCQVREKLSQQTFRGCGSCIAGPLQWWPATGWVESNGADGTLRRTPPLLPLRPQLRLRGAAVCTGSRLQTERGSRGSAAAQLGAAPMHTNQTQAASRAASHACRNMLSAATCHPSMALRHTNGTDRVMHSTYAQHSTYATNSPQKRAPATHRAPSRRGTCGSGWLPPGWALPAAGGSSGTVPPLRGWSQPRTRTAPACGWCRR